MPPLVLLVLCCVHCVASLRSRALEVVVMPQESDLKSPTVMEEKEEKEEEKEERDCGRFCQRGRAGLVCVPPCRGRGQG